MTKNLPIFCLCCDASNRRNGKLFPVVLTYFTPNGRKTALINFYEDAQENAACRPIFEHLQSSLSNNDLDLRNVSCHNADNASITKICLFIHDSRQKAVELLKITVTHIVYIMPREMALSK